MYKLKDFFGVLDSVSPISLSYKMIDSGEYDNSGIIINDHEDVNKVLFALDLSVASINKAKRLKCDTIVTHHPAIYTPLKKLDYTDAMSMPVLYAVKCGLNVISMHLNLDVSEGGIDQSLTNALGGTNYKILDYLDDTYGYGREFRIKEQSFMDYVSFVKTQLKSKKVIAYGSGKDKIKSVASFCGGGASHAEKLLLQNKLDADVIVTSDVPHHIIKEIIERDKKLIILPHYVAEEVGFKKYYEKISLSTKDKIETVYFDDRRFR